MRTEVVDALLAELMAAYDQGERDQAVVAFRVAAKFPHASPEEIDRAYGTFQETLEILLAEAFAKSKPAGSA
jgi:hypothetical protein